VVDGRYEDHLMYIDTLLLGWRGYLRQDTALRRVYYLATDTLAERILYDFNLTVGDTVTRFFKYNGVISYDTAWLISIDTFYADKSYRRFNFKIYTSGLDGPAFIVTSWIEGIGSDMGLLYPLNLSWFAKQLTCFSRNDSTVYPHFSPTACAILTGVNEVPQQISSFHI